MQNLTDRAKHRLRIAGRFLRQQGHRFDGSNFYDAIMSIINGIDLAGQAHLRGLVDWIEGYEIAERAIYGEPPSRSRSRKSKIGFGIRRALRTASPDASPR